MLFCCRNHGDLFVYNRKCAVEALKDVQDFLLREGGQAAVS